MLPPVSAPARPKHARAATKLALELFVAGYEGLDPPASFLQRITDGMVGAILFSRNLARGEDGLIDIAHLAASTAAIHAATDRPVLCSVDQEGGLVARLRAPFTHLPPMRDIGDRGDEELARAAGAQTGRECFAAGFNVDFAPVLDVDTNPENPIIGRRAFAREPVDVARFAGAFLDGLQGAQVLGCGKHFPGHGDTATDSHLALPVLHVDRARLERVEMAPFKALAARMPMVMTAHILFPELDRELPATLSRPILQRLLRGWCGFGGVIVSDDLEMKGVAEAFSFAQSVRLGLRAGVELFLVCRREDALAEAVEAAAAVLLDGGEDGAAARNAIARVRSLRQSSSKPRASEAAIRNAIRHPEGGRLRNTLGIGTV